MSNLFPEENDEISEAEKFPPGKFVENDREPPRKGANIPDKWRFKSRNLVQRPKLGSGRLTKRR